MQALVILFLRIILQDRLTLCYNNTRALDISFAIFFFVMWGIKWSINKSRMIDWTFVGFLVCSDKSLGSVGGGTSISTIYHNSTSSKRLYSVDFHFTKLEAPSNMWCSWRPNLAIVATPKCTLEQIYQKQKKSITTFKQHSNLLVPPIDLWRLESLMSCPSCHTDPHPSLKIVLSKCMLQLIKKTLANWNAKSKQQF